jgi:polyhydroxyalkanoate synthase
VFNPLSPTQLSAAAANLYDAAMRGGLADRRPTPRKIVHEARHRTLYRYLPSIEEPADRLPVLLVPPLGAPPSCFDLRRGCSFVEHLRSSGTPTYLVDFGSMRFSDRDLALEHWVEQVLPPTIQQVSADSGDRAVHLVGWSLGGVLAVLATASASNLPVRSVSVIATPLDLDRMRLRATLAPLTKLPDGPVGELIATILDEIPLPIVRVGLRVLSLPNELRAPLFVLGHLSDREALAQLEATEGFKRHLRTYTGRSMGELYNRFIAINRLADRPAEIHGEVIDLAKIRQPVLSITGADDALAPVGGAHLLADLLPSAAEVRLRSAPGGHVAVLTSQEAAATTWHEIDSFIAHWDTRVPRKRAPSVRYSIAAAGPLEGEPVILPE